MTPFTAATQPAPGAPSAAVAAPPALRARDVCLRYGAKTVLDRVSLEVPQGAIVGLVGSNGAGKTSLMRSLLGLSMPQSGAMEVLGDCPGAFTVATRERLGYVPQSPELVDWMRVGDSLDYLGSFYPRWNTTRVQRWLSAWELDPRAKIASLSLGQRQKLALIQALGHEPDLLLLDEPVASLDPLMRREFVRALFESEGERTVLISSHLLGDLERLITHLAVMRQGRVVLMDAWDALVENLVSVPLARRLPEQPGLLAQHEQSGQVTGVIDRRLLDPGHVGAIGTPVAMNLDAMFVALMS